jgi:hypothetical protein
VYRDGNDGSHLEVEMSGVRVTLDELGRILASRAPADELGPPRFVYVQVGRRETGKLRSETRTSEEDGDIVIELDEQGRVFGVEFGITR